MLSYEGIFFDKDTTELIHSLETKMLDEVNGEIHCTFKYRPSGKEIFNDIVGKSFDLFLIGYGNDGVNSGFQVLLPEEAIPYYINYHEQNPNVLKVPHITASLAKGAEASDTSNLKFSPLEKPIKITGKFGYWIKEETKEYLSFSPYFENKLR